MIFNYYLGLGSNKEPKKIYIDTAISLLEGFGDILQKSSLYKSEPWGLSDQDFFLNAIIRFQSKYNPFELLKIIKSIELKTGRNKNHVKWSAREIDIDIIFADGINIKKPNLEIPHEHFQNRKFVLLPMAELDMEYCIAGFDKKVKYFLNSCSDKSSVKQLTTMW